jgi:hypothetical protein
VKIVESQREPGNSAREQRGNGEYSKFKIQNSKQRKMRNPKPATCNLQPATCNLQPATRNPKNHAK